MSPTFARNIGIDYSGAETPTASLKGLRVYLAEGGGHPVEVLPPPSPRKYWTRKGIAEWLVERLGEDVPTLVGIDHGFSFPLRYFEVHGLLPDWPTFLDDFQRHWPTDEDHTYVDFVRNGAADNGAARTGNARWRRLTEERAGGAKSVFHFDVQGQVENLPTPGFRGCDSFAVNSATGFISGRSTAGTCLKGSPPSPKSIPRCGAAASPARDGPATNMTPIPSPPGFGAPIVTAVFLLSSNPIFNPPSGLWRRSRAGYWVFQA